MPASTGTPWYDATLCTDDDLAAQESRMPEAGKKATAEGGHSAYDGKRALAKADIGRKLERLGFNLDGLTDPTQLNRAAVFLELSYIYRDMTAKSEGVTATKADYYKDLYEQEFEDVKLSYTEPAAAADTTVRTFARFWRS